MDFPIFEDVLKNNGDLISIRKIKPALEELLINESDKNKVLEILYDIIYSKQSNKIRTPRPYAVPLHFCIEEPEVYFYVDNNNLLSIDPEKMFRSILNAQSFTSFNDCMDNVLKPVCNDNYDDLIMPRYILGMPTDKQVITLYLRATPAFCESEFENIIDLANADIDTHKQFLYHIFGQDADIKQVFVQKTMGLGFAYDGDKVLNKINYYFLYNNLTENEKIALEDKTGIKLDTKDERIRDEASLYHINVSYQEDEIKYTKMYYRKQ